MIRTHTNSFDTVSKRLKRLIILTLLIENKWVEKKFEFE